MFQTFESSSQPEQSRERVMRLRATFDDLGIDAFLIPRADEFLGEYVPAGSERLAWISGFTGSAGFAVVTRHGAHVFSDGRYTLQLRDQTDDAVWTRHELPEAKLENVLADDAGRLGIDPWLHSVAAVRKLAATFGDRLVRLPVNPVDLVWSDRVPSPQGAIAIHPIEYAGKLAREKIEDANEAVSEKAADLFVVSDALSFAWLLNLRGSDVAHNPVPRCRAIVRTGRRPIAFVNEKRLTLSARAYLTQIADLASEREFARTLAEQAKGRTVLLDADRTPDAIRGIVEWAGGSVAEGRDPTLLPRARKNETEIEGARAAHRRDGAAMAEFLYWLSSREPGTLTEIEAVERLEAIRSSVGDRLDEPLREIAFDTIAGAGPHGAIVHYRVTQETDRGLNAGELFLVDSGAQYYDGTTDITRTVAIGTPPAHARAHFTLVLKGMIAISRLRFPKGTEGRQIDVIARAALWSRGLDYGHGTGHGVGSYGAVHEGPQGISKRSSAPIEPGMILSNEPGIYIEGDYGIRIENLILAREAERTEGGGAMMSFETLTLCPIDRALIDPSLLDREERDWLDRYHARVMREVEPLLNDERVRTWLREACAPLDDQVSATDAETAVEERDLLLLDGAAASLPDRAQGDDRQRT